MGHPQCGWLFLTSPTTTNTTTRSPPGLAHNSDSGLGGGGAPIPPTLTACSTYTIVTIATTTYNASIFTTTPRPPLTAHCSDSSLGGGGAPSWERHGDLERLIDM